MSPNGAFGPQNIDREIDESRYTLVPIVLDPSISPGDELRIDVFLSGKGLPKKNKLFITYNPELIDESNPGEVNVYIVNTMGIAGAQNNSNISNNNNIPIAGVVSESNFKNSFSGPIGVARTQQDAQQYYEALKSGDVDEALSYLDIMEPDEVLPPQTEEIEIPGTSIRFQQGLFRPFEPEHGQNEILPVASEYGLYVKEDDETEDRSLESEEEQNQTEGREDQIQEGEQANENSISELSRHLVGEKHAPIEIRINTSKDCRPGDYKIPLTFTYTDSFDVYQTAATPTVHIKSWYERHRARIALLGLLISIVGLIGLEAAFNVISNLLNGI